MALSDIMRVEEKLTGGLGPDLSIAGRIEWRLLDIVVTKILGERLIRIADLRDGKICL